MIRPLARLAPGSLGWLLAFNMGLTWRGLIGSGRGPRRLIVFGVVGLLIVAALGSGLFALRGGLAHGVPQSGGALLIVGGAALFLSGLMLSAGVAASLESLFDRGDLDLLLQAPVTPQTVFAARALSVALSTALAVALIVVPLGLLAPALLGWPFLGIWPWWLATALTTASLSLWITLGLVRLLGVRRARTAASVVGALFGAGFFLLGQARNLLGPDGSRALTDRLVEDLQQAQGSAWLAALTYPVRTLWLTPLPTLVTLGASLLLFALTVRGLRRVFVDGAQSVTAVRVRRGAARQPGGPLHFRQGLAATLFKEWRLLWRDPLLLSRVLLQLLYLLPLMFSVGRLGQGHLLFGSGGVLLAASLAGALANLTLNAEDAPDLLRLAPVGLEGTRRAKLAAALLPVWALMALVYGWFATHAVAAWGWYALCMLVATLGTALIYLWRPLPVRRADVFRSRQGGTDLLSSIGRLTLILFVSGAAAGLPTHAWWGFAALAAGLGLGLLFWRLRSLDG